MSRPGGLRLLGGVRAALGLAWLAGLATGARAAGAGLPRAGRTAAAVLAVRDVAQGALLVSRPEPSSVEAGAVVDLLHGLSMLPVLAAVPRYRTAASVSGAAAATWVGVAVGALRARGS